jgi:hypothetical protein
LSAECPSASSAKRDLATEGPVGPRLRLEASEADEAGKVESERRRSGCRLRVSGSRFKFQVSS